MINRIEVVCLTLPTIDVTEIYRPIFSHFNFKCSNTIFHSHVDILNVFFCCYSVLFHKTVDLVAMTALSCWYHMYRSEISGIAKNINSNIAMQNSKIQFDAIQRKQVVPHNECQHMHVRRCWIGWILSATAIIWVQPKNIIRQLHNWKWAIYREIQFIFEIV